jgi:hypothetical protein
MAAGTFSQQHSVEADPMQGTKHGCWPPAAVPAHLLTAAVPRHPSRCDVVQQVPPIHVLGDQPRL